MYTKVIKRNFTFSISSAVLWPRRWYGPQRVACRLSWTRNRVTGGHCYRFVESFFFRIFTLNTSNDPIAVTYFVSDTHTKVTIIYTVQESKTVCRSLRRSSLSFYDRRRDDNRGGSQSFPGARLPSVVVVSRVRWWNHRVQAANDGRSRAIYPYDDVDADTWCQTAPRGIEWRGT